MGHSGDELADSRQPFLLHQLALRKLQPLQILFRFAEQPRHFLRQQHLPQEDAHCHQHDANQRHRDAKRPQPACLRQPEQHPKPDEGKRQHRQNRQETGQIRGALLLGSR